MKWKTVAGSAVISMLAVTGWLTRSASLGTTAKPSDVTPTGSPAKIADAGRLSVAVIPACPLHPRPGLDDLTAADTEVDPDLRDAMIENAGAAVELSELPALLDLLKIDSRPAAVELSRLLLMRWAQSDPGAASAWVANLPEGAFRRDAHERVAVAWAESDLTSARDWVRGLPEGGDRHTAVEFLAYELARTDPVAALELAAGLPPAIARDELIVHAVSQWTDADPAAAMEWSALVTDPALRSRLFGAVATAFAESNGVDAADLVARSLDESEEQDRAAIAVVQRWSQASPIDAAAWVARFPESPVRNAAVRTLVQIWAATDPQSSGLWVRELPDGPVRDVAVAAFIEVLAEGGALTAATAGPAAPENRENDAPDL